MSASLTPTRQRLEQARIGRDLLPIGRLMRVVAGLSLLAAAFLTGSQLAKSGGQSNQALAAFAISAVAYTVATWLVGEQLFARLGPWLSAIVLVAPATLALFFLPTMASAGYDAFLGVSMLVQAANRYGGCEILGIPTLIVRRRYTVYCALNGGDVVEHWLRRQAVLLRWVVGVLAFVGIILLIGVASAVAGPTGESVLYLAFLVVGFAVSHRAISDLESTPTASG
jgi:hypothetical protein